MATRKMLRSTDWKAAQHENFHDDLEGARKLVRQVLDKVTLGPGFEYAEPDGAVGITAKVPTMHFRIEIPGVDIGEFLETDRGSAYVQGADVENVFSGVAPASC